MSNAKEKYRIKWTTRFKKDYKLECVKVFL